MLRLVAIVLFVAGLVAGMKLERSIQSGRCLEAGGTVDARGLCAGL